MITLTLPDDFHTAFFAQNAQAHCSKRQGNDSELYDAGRLQFVLISVR